MRLLLDQCLPRRAKFLFAEAGHECETVRDAERSNGVGTDGKFPFL